MTDLDRLEQEREKATAFKEDLFDFYNNNWDGLVDRLKALEQKDVDLADDLVAVFPGLANGEDEVNGGDLVDWLSFRLAGTEGDDDDQDEVCDECGNEIPDHDGGGAANKHHDPSCSLYDPDQE